MSFIKKIFGKSSGEQALANFQPVSFSSPGLSGTFKDNRFTLRRGEEAGAALGDIRSLSQEQAGAFRGLRDRVRPGFGELTRTRIDAIRSAGKRTVGNLREELGKRRVLGSTFASREIASTEAEFGRIEEQSRAESFLQELVLTGELIKEEFSAALQGIGITLQQLNFESALAANLSQSASDQLLAAAGASAEVAAARRSGNMELFMELFGDKISDLLGL